MRTMKHVALAAAAAFALALAGCGGGGSGGPKTPTDPPKTKLSYATDLNASVAALTKLAGAVDADGSALKMASDASKKLSTEGSDGVSSVAMMNAQAILSAKMQLEAAITDAKAKKTDAESAKDGADADVTAALNTAIAAADTQIEAADKVSLATYVNMVTGGATADPQGTPTSIGKGVAEAIEAAITAGRFGNGSVPGASVENEVEFSNAVGMTWAMIGSNLVDITVVEGPANFRTAKAMAVADGTKVSSYYTATNEPTVGTVANQTEVTSNVVYKGITGMLVCAGSDCAVAAPASGTDAADRLLKGSWYFTTLQAGEDTKYVLNEATTTITDDYTPEVLYARYGHWLTVDGNGDATINRYAQASGGNPPTDFSTNPAGVGTATYKGGAAGMSVHKTFNTDGTQASIASGAFTADVTLYATFGSSATISGEINNFKGSAVGSWTVTLMGTGTNATAVLDSTAGTVESGAVAKGSGTNANTGRWSGSSYGNDSDKAPAGIYGLFNANFSDGAATGAYATKKQ